MLQNALREDALTAVSEGFELRVGLPWIRSMPLSSVSKVSVELDGAAVGGELEVRLGVGPIPAVALADQAGWWFIQGRLVLLLPGLFAERGLSRHHVSVDFELMVPYLQAGGEGPLVLPIHMEAMLPVSRRGSAGVSRDVA